MNKTKNPLNNDNFNDEIIILIQNNAILNNYLGLISCLSGRGESITLLVENTVNVDKLHKVSSVGIMTYKLSKYLSYWEEIFNYCNLHKSINHSKSFTERYDWRVKRFSKFKPEVKRRGLLIYFYLIRRYIYLHHDSILIRFLSVTNLSQFIQPIFYKLFSINIFNALNKFTDKKAVLIIPYWGLNLECNFLLYHIRKSRINGVKSIFFQENWDNLSSKSIMYYKPDAIAVWGQQTKCHAIEIQGFVGRKIFFLQSPRYIDFYDYWNHIRRFCDNNKSNKTILFLGDSTESNEVSLILKISNYIRLNHPEWTILYRPHPFMHSEYKLKFTKNNLPNNVRLDDEFLHTYFENINTPFSTEANLEILINRFKASDIIVTGGSTCFLESVMTLKPTLLINGKLRTVTALDKTHFDGIASLGRVIIANEEELADTHLNELFENYIASTINTNGVPKDILDKINYYFDFNGRSYMSRFYEILVQTNSDYS